jgi:chemotaxis protein MotB
MAKQYETWSEPEYKVPRRGGWLGWLLFVLLAAGVGAFVYYLYMPLRAHRTDLQRQIEDRDQRAKRAAQKLKDSETKLDDMKRSQESLSGQLVQTQAEKEKIEAELKRLQGELSSKLEGEIQAGNVTIKRRGNDLVVDLADKILFESGNSDVHESGQKVLGQVAPTLAELKQYTIQVAGHTDSAKVVSPTTQERFPTNWELSTARATNVVRFLQERGRVPGDRLTAMGFAQYRPAANNATAEGRQQNRRIELVLIRN